MAPAMNKGGEGTSIQLKNCINIVQRENSMVFLFSRRRLIFRPDAL
jgi:hypothetical protein